MIREVTQDELHMISGGDMDVVLADNLFYGNDMNTVSAMSMDDNGDGSYNLTLTFDDSLAYSTSSTMARTATTNANGQSNTRSVTTTIKRDSGQTTVSGSFTGKLTVLGRGVTVSGKVTVVGPRTITTSTVTRSGSTPPKIPIPKKSSN